MLSEPDLAAWTKRNGLSHEAESVISNVRCSDPARRVGGGRSNVTGRYPSRKMGVTIQFESHRVELPAIIELEYDDGVLEYYDQPPSIKLDYYSAGGRRLGVLHTPDFFVLRATSAGWEECKTEEELVRLSEHNPKRYCSRHDVWICPPGSAYAERFGLYYQVRSSGTINWLFQRNIQFLEDYLRTESKVSSAHRQLVLAHVAARPMCCLDDLFRATEGEVTRDEIYSLIAIGDIYVDLLSAVLPEPEKVPVRLEKPPQDDSRRSSASERPVLRAGDALEWDGKIWTVANVGNTAVSLMAEGQSIFAIPLDRFAECIRQNRIRVLIQPQRESSSPQIQTRLLQASEADMTDAARRFQVVSRAMRGELHDAVPPRTLRRWKAAYLAAQDEHGTGYLGLLPRPNRGNPADRLSQKARSLMIEFVDKDYETVKQKTMYSAWAAPARR